jgi:hypothetical protein
MNLLEAKTISKEKAQKEFTATKKKEHSELEEKLKHLEHPEDHMLNAGYAGFHHAVNTLHQAHGILSGHETDAKVSEKFDGSPSVVFGRHPETGRVFVTTKSAFNQNPKINYTDHDVDTNHGHAPGLASKLKETLKHIHKILPAGPGVYQGDLLHSEEDVEKKDGKYQFTPNTITYSTPVNSEEGKKITKSKIGLAIHTKYNGKRWDDLKAEYNPDLKDFKEHPDVHVVKPDLKLDPKKYSPALKKTFNDEMAKADQAYKDADHTPTEHVEAHHTPFKSYLNQQINAGKKPSIEGYKKWSTEKHQKDIDKLKTPAVKAAKSARHDLAMRLVDENSKHFNALIKTHNHLINAKNALVKAFNQSQKFETHVDGQPVKTEGTVISVNNRPSKLNDREEFNRLNALKSKNRKPVTEEHTNNSHVTFAFGRMNPPTTGHAKLVEKMHEVAKEKGGPVHLDVSHSHEPKKNPLDPQTKVKHVKRFFPGTHVEAATKEHPSFLHRLSKLHQAGYHHVTVVAGSDRTEEYKHLIHKYNGVHGSHGHFNFKSHEVVSSGARDPDSEGTEGMSASKMRKHASEGNYKEFKKGVPEHVSEKHSKEMYDDVRKGLGIRESLSFMKFFRQG